MSSPTSARWNPLRAAAGAWERTLGAPPRILLPLLLAFNLGLVFWTARVPLRDFPNSGDEYAFLLSAILFSENRLWVESPEPRDSFTLYHVINNHRYFGKYPPGWPLLLSVGVRVGIPGLINPILGALALLVVFRIAKETLGVAAGVATLCVMATNPFFILNSASYFSHPSCMLFLALTSLFVLRGLREPESWRNGLLVGLCAGMAFAIRPFTAFGFLLPLGAAMIFRAALPRPELRRSRSVLAAASAFGACLALYGLYNHLQTGSPWTQPYQLYDPRDGLGRTSSSNDWNWGFRYNLVERFRELNRWVPFFPVFVAAYFVLRRRARPPGSIGVVLLGAASLGLCHVAFLYDPVNQYGPRYVYEACFPLFLAAGFVLSRLKRTGLPALLLLVGLQVGLFSTEVRRHAEQIRGRSEIYECARREGIGPALVFLRTGSGSMEARDLTRNGIHFETQPVLYVLDLGKQRNFEVIENYPGRKPYVYSWDPGSGNGRLEPYPLP